jgi:glycosyltransferase involved in cell wall biosynthesis
MDPARPKVTLFIPTLNEAEGLKKIRSRIESKWVDQILVVDGNSTDGTVDVARAHGYETLVQKERGIRRAYNEGFAKVRGDIVITFSPDGNCLPELIPELIRKIDDEGYDMVIASRYAPGAKSEDDDLLTGFGNAFFTWIINRLHGGRYTDAMGIYRAYRTRLFYELELDRDEGYRMERWLHTVIGIEPLLSVRAAKRRLKVGEIPGDEPKRFAGHRKLQIFRWGVSYLLQVLREVFFWR